MIVKHDTRRGRITLYCDEEEKPDFEKVLDTLCRDYNCELVHRMYRIGDSVLQDFLCRTDWRLYTLESHQIESLHGRGTRIFGRRISVLAMNSMGYKTDSESLRVMGAKVRNTYVHGR